MNFQEIYDPKININTMKLNKTLSSKRGRLSNSGIPKLVNKYTRNKMSEQLDARTS